MKTLLFSLHSKSSGNGKLVYALQFHIYDGESMKRTVAIVFLFVAVCLYRQAFAQTSARITYTLHREASPTADQQDAYTKIAAAMDRAVDYYNTYTTITKKLNIYYNTSVSTADASFEGNIRFGSNRSYMVVLTALHEMAHTVGIGTTTEYRNLIRDNVFTGTRATAVLRELTSDPEAVLKGDAQHFWPYGLNYASEYTSDDDYIFHCRIVNAIYQDMFGVEELYRTCRIRSVHDGRFMTATDDNQLTISDRRDTASVVDLISLSDGNTFRIGFGDRVLDMPNESMQAGSAAGVWSWNGGAHQKVRFEFITDGREDTAMHIIMTHSSLYLVADGDRIIQNGSAPQEELRLWEFVDTASGTSVERRRVYDGSATYFSGESIKPLPVRSLCDAYCAGYTVVDLMGRPLRPASADRPANIVPGSYVIADGPAGFVNRRVRPLSVK